MIEFQTIEKSYAGVRAVGPVSFALRPGITLGLVGENGAGKSTLMNILGGNIMPDAGRMLLEGKPYAPKHPGQAMDCGISFIHQELNLFGNLSIADNLFLNHFPRRGWLPFIKPDSLMRQACERLSQVGLELDPRTLLERLSVGECQLVEIAKALGNNPRLIIFDEPTTSLSARESERLFQIIARLRAQRISIIYISHRLEDVLNICDEIVVLRDGTVTGGGLAREFSVDHLITLMVGRSLDQYYPTRIPTNLGDVVLEARAVSQPGVVRNVSFGLRAGEILGVAGLLGAGRSELARILFGLDPHATGEIWLKGVLLGKTRTRRRIACGMAFVTEDRRTEGLCLEGSLSHNMALACLPSHARGRLGLIDGSRLGAAIGATREAVRLSPKAADDLPVGFLSGGNQQKVVLAKWLLTQPDVLILDEPTRGIDVGARFEIYQIIQSLAARGAGVLMISSEMEELMGLCDRILVMNRGEIVDDLTRADFDGKRILRAALSGGETG